MKISNTLCVATLMLTCIGVFVHAQDESPLNRITWHDKDGYELPAPMTVVDYGSMPVQLTLRGRDVLVNGQRTSQLRPYDLAVLEAVVGKNVAAIAAVLKEQRHPTTMQIEFAVLRQVDSGQLTRMPIAMLAADDRVLAMQAGRQIFQQRQVLAQLAAARAVAAGRLALTGPPVPGTVGATGTMGANYEQQGQFEGQFGDQFGPDLAGGAESSGGIED